MARAGSTTGGQIGLAEIAAAQQRDAERAEKLRRAGLEADAARGLDAAIGEFCRNGAAFAERHGIGARYRGDAGKRLEPRQRVLRQKARASEGVRREAQRRCQHGAGLVAGVGVEICASRPAGTCPRPPAARDSKPLGKSPARCAGGALVASPAAESYPFSERGEIHLERFQGRRQCRESIRRRRPHRKCKRRCASRASSGKSARWCARNWKSSRGNMKGR